MLNFKYFNNVVLYFLSVYELEFVYIVGVYYLVQDYFLIIMSNLQGFGLLSIPLKENVKFYFILILFISFIF